MPLRSVVLLSSPLLGAEFCAWPLTIGANSILTDLAQGRHCLRLSNGLHRPGSGQDRLDLRLMAPNNLYGDCTVCQSHNSMHTILAAISVELGIWNAMGR